MGDILNIYSCLIPIEESVALATGETVGFLGVKRVLDSPEKKDTVWVCPLQYY